MWRKARNEPEVLLVHRPRWEDWSFPKGKLDRNEPAYAAALREVLEETGLTVRLGPRLPDTTYTVSGGQTKTVNYWCARTIGGSDISAYPRNAEIDDLTWVPLSRAVGELSYPFDVDLLEEFASAAYDTAPLIVLRHAHARSRRAWRADDSERPLKADGKEQSHRLVPLLRAYGIKRVVSSDAVRCVDSVLPYVNENPTARLQLDPSISEDTFDAEGLGSRIRKELDSSRRVVICSHRPVLPAIYEALGIEAEPLEPAALSVVHRRAGRVRDVEHYRTP